MLLLQSIRLISLWLVPSIAFAVIGEVSETSGVAAQIERSGTELTADLETDIQSMDEVETTNGRLKIAFVDETEVSLTEHTYLEINEYVYDPDPAKSVWHSTLLRALRDLLLVNWDLYPEKTLAYRRLLPL